MGGLTSHLPPHGAAPKGLFAPVTWSCLSLGQPFPSVMRERCPTPQIHMHPDPPNAITFGNRVFAHGISYGCQDGALLELGWALNSVT